MGTCLSKKQAPSTTTHSIKRKKKKKKKDEESAGLAPPPLPPEDEAVVKEVLMETPKPGSKPRPPEYALKGPPVEKAGVSVPAVVDMRSEEASDVCSVSESFSVSTSATDRRGPGGEAAAEDGEVVDMGQVASKWRRPPEMSPAGKTHRPPRKRSASGEFPSWRDPRGGAAPAGSGRGGGRSASSPLKRRDGRPFPGRGDASRCTRQLSNAAAAGAARRDPGERSGRRSMSPAAKREASDLRRAAVGCGSRGEEGVAGRSSSAKCGAGRASPRRAHPPSGTPAEEPGRRRAAGVEETEERRDGATLPPPGQKESLENPLVSLECFIFL